MCVRFFFPQIKRNIQIIIVSLQVCNGYLHNVIPQCHVTWFALLQLMSSLQCFITICFVFFGFSTCTWINFFQFTDCKRSFFRIFTFISIIEINQLRFTVFQFCDDKSHLKPPVSQMYITDYFVSYKTADSFNTLSDNCRTKMSYVKRFRNVRSAIINYDCLWLFRCLYRIFRICSHFFHIICKKLFFHSEIDKSWFNNLRCGKDLAVL